MSIGKFVVTVVAIRTARSIPRFAMVCCLLSVASGKNVMAAPPRELEVGVGDSRFQRDFDTKKEQTLRLVDLTTTVEKTRRLTAWIWEKRADVEWKSRAGLTREEMQQEVTVSDEAGLRLTHMAAYGTAKTERYSAIWEKSEGPAMSIKYGIPHKKLQDVSRKFAEEGFRPVRIAAVTLDRRAELTGVWEKATDPPRELQAGLSNARFKRELRSRLRRGFRIVQICCYTEDGRMQFACIWEKSDGPEQQVDLGVTRAAVERLGRQQERQKFVALQISSCTLNFRALYTVVWEKTADKP